MPTDIRSIDDAPAVQFYQEVDHFRNIDILIFGDRNAGRKTFMEQFKAHNTGMHQSKSKSQNCEYLRKTVRMPCEENVIAHLRIWLQTQQERPFTTRLFREADCVLYILDVTKAPDETRRKVEGLKNLLDNECSEKAVRILVGNKIDLLE